MASGEVDVSVQSLVAVVDMLSHPIPYTVSLA
jgi:hypothetical protein